MNDYVNLDRIAAEKSQEIINLCENIQGIKNPIETLERLVTKTLGVLQEQGVYAMMLFLYSRSSNEKRVSEESILPVIIETLQHIPGFSNNQNLLEGNREDVLKFYAEEITPNLDLLLLIRNLYEQILIYTRYHAKAKGG